MQLSAMLSTFTIFALSCQYTCASVVCFFALLYVICVQQLESFLRFHNASHPTSKSTYCRQHRAGDKKSTSTSTPVGLDGTLYYIDVIRRCRDDVILMLFSSCLRVQWVIMTSIRTLLCVTEMYNIVLTLIILTGPSPVRCFVNAVNRLRIVWWTLPCISVSTNNTVYSVFDAYLM